MSASTVREFQPSDLPWAEKLIGAQMGGRQQARRGELVDALAFPGFVSVVADAPEGIITYDARERDVEVVYLEVELESRHLGLGTALLRTVIDNVPADRIWLVTTNDNLDALRFYQRRGFRISEVRPGAITEARQQLKPQIPLVGYHSIPLRDEIEMVYTGES